MLDDCPGDFRALLSALHDTAMPTQLLIATTNAGKLRDFRVAAAAHAAEFQIDPLPNLGAIAVAPENGATFAENACSKAVYYSYIAPGGIVLADDSGLEVDALEGAPGVHSARYAREAGLQAGELSMSDDERNNRLLLENLCKTPAAKRSARYRCVLAAARDGEIVASAEGTVEGEILTVPRGHGGFGYDPLFFLPGRNGTMAELDLETKHGLSHRGQALRELLRKLRA